MDCIIFIVMLVFGIMIIVKGQMPLGGGRVCYGMPARVAGGVLIATGIIIMLAALGAGVVLGFQAAKENRPMDPTDVLPFAIGIDCGGIILGTLIAVGIGYAYGEPKHKPKPDLDDVYDEPFVRKHRDDTTDRSVEPDSFTDRPEDQPRRRIDDRIQERQPSTASAPFP
jgi:hypothetical protein